MNEKTSAVRTHRKPRGPMSMSAKIRRALNQGVPVKEIAKRYKVETNFVHNIRWKENKKREEQAKAQAQVNLPPASATVDFTYDASSQSLVPVVISPPVPSQVPSPVSSEVQQQPGGIVWLIDKKEAAPNPPAVEAKPSLWQRIKFWAFGIRA